MKLSLLTMAAPMAPFKILRDLHQENNNVKVIRFTRNFGQHSAVAAGFDFAQDEIVITIMKTLCGYYVF